MKKFFRKIFGRNWAERRRRKNVDAAWAELDKALARFEAQKIQSLFDKPARDAKGRWIFLDAEKPDSGCCGGGNCKCKKK